MNGIGVFCGTLAEVGRLRNLRVMKEPSGVRLPAEELGLGPKHTTWAEEIRQSLERNLVASG